MKFREATLADIPGMQLVRNSVKENVLSNPSLVKESDYIAYISERGKGWVCEVEGNVLGFAIADLIDNNIWALFVHPDHEQKGIGKKLHQLMMDWYFSKEDIVWLSTEPDSKADRFYRNLGWKPTGTTTSGEVRFEMKAEDWKKSSIH